MISLEFVYSYINENLQNVTVSKNGTHFLARCPICGDSKKSKTKRRFNLDWNNGSPIYHCFNCGDSGNFIELYSFMEGITEAEAKKRLFSFDIESLKQSLSKTPKKNGKKDEVKYDNYNYILDDCVSKNSQADGILEKQYQQHLIKFINERKLPLDVPVYIAYKGDYAGRIIFPIIENKTIIYFQARSLNKNTDQKYKNPGVPKGSIVYNKENFDRSKYIIVTEGLIDAIHIGTQGTSALGAVVRDSFIQELYRYTDKGVIIAMDNDKTGIKETIRILNESKFSPRLLYFLILNNKYSIRKDIGELAQFEQIPNMYDFVVSNSYSKFEATLQLKMRGYLLNENYSNGKGLRSNK